MNVWDIWRFIFKKKLYFGHSHRKMFFFLEILISPLPSSNKCILVHNNFSYNINTDKEHLFRPPLREIKKLEQSTKPSSDPWQNHISFCLYLFFFSFISECMVCNRMRKPCGKTRWKNNALWKKKMFEHVRT